MGIFGAMTTAVGGLRAQSYALENIAGNIANSQTTGFKRVDTSFADLVPESTPNRQYAGSVVASSRGTNSIQGDVQNATVDTYMAINGEGFFVVQKPTGFPDGQPVFSGVDLYTRRGDFELDKDGFLVNGTGYYLKTIAVDPTTGNLVGSVPQVLPFSGDFLPANPTSLIEYRANLASYPRTTNADPNIPGSERLDSAGFSVDPTVAGTGTVVANDLPVFLDETIAGGALTVFDTQGSSVNMQFRWGKLPDVAAVATGTADLNPALDLGATYDTDTVTITVDGVPTVLTIDTGAMSDSDELLAAINAIAGIGASLNGSDQIEITADSNTTTFSIAYSDAGIGTDLGLAANTFPPDTTDRWELFYLSDSSATGAQTAWVNAGTTYVFDSAGQLTPAIPTITLSAVTVDGISLGNITLEHGSNGITEFADANGIAEINTLDQNGYPAGALQTISINEKGRVVGSYTNGHTIELAEIPLAQFNGVNKLNRLDGGGFEATSESGPAIFGAGGKINSKSLENSNTDISDEFTKLIVTQQAYAANTRIVSTADQMLQETLNMIR